MQDITLSTFQSTPYTTLNITYIMRHNILVGNALLARVIAFPCNDTPASLDRRQNRFTVFFFSAYFLLELTPSKKYGDRKTNKELKTDKRYSGESYQQIKKPTRDLIGTKKGRIGANL